MNAPLPYSRLADRRGEPARAARARSNERALNADQPPLSPLLGAEALGAPASLRRRQAAARRLPPLADGLVDPIAPKHTPSRQQTLLEVVVGDRTVWFYGLTRRQFITLCRRAGITRWMKDTRTFCVQRADADAAEMIAIADHGLGWRTTVRNDDR